MSVSRIESSRPIAFNEGGASGIVENIGRSFLGIVSCVDTVGSIFVRIAIILAATTAAVAVGIAKASVMSALAAGSITYIILRILIRPKPIEM